MKQKHEKIQTNIFQNWDKNSCYKCPKKKHKIDLGLSFGQLSGWMIWKLLGETIFFGGLQICSFCYKWLHWLGVCKIFKSQMGKFTRYHWFDEVCCYIWLHWSMNCLHLWTHKWRLPYILYRNQVKHETSF